MGMILHWKGKKQTETAGRPHSIPFGWAHQRREPDRFVRRGHGPVPRASHTAASARAILEAGCCYLGVVENLWIKLILLYYNIIT
jgi:hypothetical protein